MTRVRPPSQANLAASVRTRLLNVAKAQVLAPTEL